MPHLVTCLNGTPIFKWRVDLRIDTIKEMCLKEIGLQNSLTIQGIYLAFYPSLRKLVSLSCIKAYFESWVKLLGPPLSTSQTLIYF